MAARLADLEVLFLDCQATGPASRDGHLLEIGWCRATAVNAADAPATAQLVALPAGQRIPPRVRELTGISGFDLRGAPGPELAWDAMVSRPSAIPVATAIHYSRFEEPFLRQLHQSLCPGGDFPLDIVCTNQIARRLLPELPRRTLRALAGYFGRSVGKLRRSREHVAATAFVWGELVGLLSERERIETWSELRTWLAGPSVGRRARVYPMPREVRLALPDRPGVYRMHRQGGQLLYVGKATSLHRRVNSYFQKQARVHERTLEMLTQARGLSFLPTESALEAALVEADEIKRFSPPYNVALSPADRRLCFASRDLLRTGERADEVHRIGPIPSREAVASLAGLGRVLEGRSRPGAAEVLGVPRSSAPDAGSFAAGIEVFTAAHPEALGGRLGALLRLGTRLWRDGLDAEPLDPDDSAPRPAERRWDPPTVARQLEEVVARATHALRRARWLCLLGESALRWREAERVRILVLDGGEIASCRDASDGEHAPVPPGFRRTTLERQRAFTLASFDRMRVLTTELRRIADPSIEVRLGPRALLGAGRLARVLRWV
ncbi:MAG: GIY-YIG nuclease family protein [Deltaproteobacteria bacterium]|nr:GIY-YIG nuclease family protein [Deltaproteobacteria bacterium]